MKTPDLKWPDGGMSNTRANLEAWVDRLMAAEKGAK